MGSIHPLDKADNATKANPMERFWHQENAFEAWIQQHMLDGHVLNCVKGHNSWSAGRPYLLHHAECRMLTDHNPTHRQELHNIEVL